MSFSIPIFADDTYSSLVDAIANGATTYNLENNEIETTDLGTLQNNLTITGNGYSISGNLFKGLVVNQEQTLIIKNSKLNEFYGYLESSAGSCLDGIVIYNGGITEINSVKFDNNILTVNNPNAWAIGNGQKARGSVIYNCNNSLMDVKNTIFSNNTINVYGLCSGGFGGAIYNEGTINFYEQNLFSSNRVARFKYYSYYARGGAIYNTSSGIINFSENSQINFLNNSAPDHDNYGEKNSYGGAIYNEGIINFKGIITFKGNRQSTGPNDIYNIGTLNFDNAKVYMDGGIDGNNYGMINILGNTELSLHSNSTITGNSLSVGIEDEHWTGSLNINSGVIENLITTNFYTDNGILKFDAKLKDGEGESDFFGITGTASGILNITGINVLEDYTGQSGTITLFSGGDLTDLTISTTNYLLVYNKQLINLTPLSGSDNGKLSYSLGGTITLPDVVQSTQLYRSYLFTSEDEIYGTLDIAEFEAKNELPNDRANVNDFSPLGIMTTGKLIIDGKVRHKLTLNGIGQSLTDAEGGDAGSVYGVIIQNDTELTFDDIEITGELTGGNFVKNSLLEQNALAGNVYLTKIDSGTLNFNNTNISTVTLKGGSLSVTGNVGIYFSGNNNTIKGGDAEFVRVSSGDVTMTSAAISSVTISGGSLSTTGSSNYGILFPGGGDNTVSGGNAYFTKISTGQVHMTSATISNVTVCGGSIGGTGGFGISFSDSNNTVSGGNGCFVRMNIGTINITGSTISSVTISGGFLSATGSSNLGIYFSGIDNTGSGGNAYFTKISTGEIQITGSKITDIKVTGGNLYASSISGANTNGNIVKAGDAYGFVVDSGTLSIIGSTVNMQVLAGVSTVDGSGSELAHNGNVYGIWANNVNSKVEIKNSSVTLDVTKQTGGNGQAGEIYGIYSNGALEIENSYISLVNGEITVSKVNNLTANNFNLAIDADLNAQTSDYFIITGIARGNVITDINILNYDGVSAGTITLFTKAGGSFNNFTITPTDVIDMENKKVLMFTALSGDNLGKLSYGTFNYDLPHAVQAKTVEMEYIFTDNETYETDNQLPVDWINAHDFSPLGVMTRGKLTVKNDDNGPHKLTLNGTGQGLTDAAGGDAGSVYGLIIQNGSELTFDDIEVTGTLTGGDFTKSSTLSQSASAGSAYLAKIDSGTLIIEKTDIGTITIDGGYISLHGDSFGGFNSEGAYNKIVSGGNAYFVGIDTGTIKIKDSDIENIRINGGYIFSTDKYFGIAVYDEMDVICGGNSSFVNISSGTAIIQDSKLSNITIDGGMLFTKADMDNGIGLLTDGSAYNTISGGNAYFNIMDTGFFDIKNSTISNVKIYAGNIHAQGEGDAIGISGNHETVKGGDAYFTKVSTGEVSITNSEITDVKITGGNLYINSTVQNYGVNNIFEAGDAYGFAVDSGTLSVIGSTISMQVIAGSASVAEAYNGTAYVIYLGETSTGTIKNSSVTFVTGIAEGGQGTGGNSYGIYAATSTILNIEQSTMNITGNNGIFALADSKIKISESSVTLKAANGIYSNGEVEIDNSYLNMIDDGQITENKADILTIEDTEMQIDVDLQEKQVDNWQITTSASGNLEITKINKLGQIEITKDNYTGIIGHLFAGGSLNGLNVTLALTEDEKNIDNVFFVYNKRRIGLGIEKTENNIDLVYGAFGTATDLPAAVQNTQYSTRTYVFAGSESYSTNQPGLPSTLDFSPLGKMTMGNLLVDGNGKNKLTLTGAGESLTDVESGNAGNVYGLIIQNGSELTFEDIEITGELTGGNFTKNSTLSQTASAGSAYLAKIDSGTLNFNNTNISTLTITGGSISAKSAGAATNGYGIKLSGNSNEIVGGDSYFIGIDTGTINIVGSTISAVIIKGGVIDTSGNSTVGVVISGNSSEIFGGSSYFAKLDTGTINTTSSIINNITITGGDIILNDISSGIYVENGSGKVNGGNGYFEKVSTGTVEIVSTTINNIEINGGSLLLNAGGNSGATYGVTFKSYGNNTNIGGGSASFVQANIGTINITTSTISSVTINGGIIDLDDITSPILNSGQNNKVSGGNSYFVKIDTGIVNITSSVISTVTIDAGLMNMNMKDNPSIMYNDNNKTIGGYGYFVKADSGTINITTSTISSVTINGGLINFTGEFILANGSGEIIGGNGYFVNVSTGEINIIDSEITNVTVRGGDILSANTPDFFDSNIIKAGDAYGFALDSGTLSVIGSTISMQVIAGSASVAEAYNGTAYGMYLGEISTGTIQNSNITLNTGIAEGAAGIGGNSYGIYAATSTILNIEQSTMNITGNNGIYALANSKTNIINSSVTINATVSGINSSGDVKIENSYFSISDGQITENQAKTLNVTDSILAIDAKIDISSGNLTADYFKITGTENALSGDITLQLSLPEYLVDNNIVVSSNSLKSVTLFVDNSSNAVTGLSSLNLDKDYYFETGNIIYQLYTNTSNSSLFYKNLNLKEHLNRSWIYSYTLFEDETNNKEEGFKGFNEIGKTGIVNKTSFTVVGNNYTVDGGGYSGIVLEPEQTLNISSVTWTNFQSENGGVIYNNAGTVNLTSVTFNSNIATGTNTVAGKGGAIANYDGTVNIIDGATFTNNNADYGKDIYNTGTVNFESGSSTLDGGIMGEGTVNIKNGADVIFEDNANLQQYGLNINEGGLLQINASSLTVTDTIENAGTITFTGGTNNNSINGTGTLEITGNVINENSISQSTVTIANNIVLTNNSQIITNNIIGNEVENNGVLFVNLKDENSYGLQKLTRTTNTDGSLWLEGSADKEIELSIAGKTINQNIVDLHSEKKKLTLKDGTITANEIYNRSGSLLYLSSIRLVTTKFVNNVTGTSINTITVFENGSSVSGKIYNNKGTIDILANNFTTEDDITADIEYQTDITKNILNIGSATVAASNVISSHTIEYQNITVSSGSLTMENGGVYGKIDNSAVTIREAGKLSVQADKITNLRNSDGSTANIAISNNGILEFVGNNSTNLNNIIGDNGNLIINANVINEGIISQSTITINAEKTFTTNASSVTASKVMENAGELIFEAATDMINGSVIDGIADDSGNKIYGNLTVKNTLTNNKNITQNNITIENGIFTNNAVVEATGTFTNNATVNNSSSIIANAFINNGELTSNAESIVIESGLLENAGVYNVTGGTISYAITGGASNGIININTNEVTISSAISNNTVNVGTTAATAPIEVKLTKEDVLANSALVIKDGAIINTINGSTGTVSPNSIEIEGGANWNWKLNVDLKTETADNLKNVISVGENSQATITEIEFVNDYKKAQETGNIIIADNDIKATIDSNYLNENGLIYTTNLKYKITVGTDSANNTVLSFIADGYGGLPNAVYDGASIYQVTGDEDGKDYVYEWIKDPKEPEEAVIVHDTLKNNMTITGTDSGKILTTSNTAVVEGIKTSSYSLTVKDLDEYSGFNNAITVNQTDDSSGTLNAINVTFSSNTGNAVIANSGTVTLNNVIFDSNTVTTVVANEQELTISSATFTNNTILSAAVINTGNATFDGVKFTGNTIAEAKDVLNNGTLLLTGTASEFEYGILGTGTTIIDGILTDMTDKFFVQNNIEISNDEGSGLTVTVAKLSSGTAKTELITNNGNLVLIGSTTASGLQTAIAGTGNTEMQQTITVSTNIAQNNIALTGATVTVSTETNATVKATTINVDENSSLIANANNINTFDLTYGKIENAGTVTFTGGTNNNVINGTGTLKITGNVTNENSVSQSTVTINEGASFTTNASSVTASKVMENAGELIFEATTDMINGNVIKGIGNALGNLTISGNLTNNKNITQNNITIENGIFTNNAVVEATGTFTNNATVNNSSSIIANNLINNNLIYNYDSITAGTITNDGYMANNGGTIVSTSIVNNHIFANIEGSITAGTIENIAGAAVYNEQNAVIQSTNIVNSGTIESTGAIKVTGILTNEGEITNYDGGTITAENAAIENKGIITSNASAIKTVAINNDGGTFNVTGGIIEGYNVMGTLENSTVNILGDVEISTDNYVSQNKVILGNGTDHASLKLDNETGLRTSQLVITNNTALDTRNNQTGGINAGGLITIENGAVWSYSFDMDLQNATADTLLNVFAGDNSVANIGNINILTDKAEKSYILISTGAKGNINVSSAVIYTTNMRYLIKNSTMSDTYSTWLEIGSTGYGGLPSAVYDGASIYSVTGLEDDEQHDYVTEWIEGQNTLKADLKIKGNERILLSSNNITGLKTDIYSLEISSLTSFAGFENAITVNDVEGNLKVTDVTFSSNTGSAVIASSGNVVLSGVTFDQTNTATIDVANDGELLLTGSATTFNKGISGTGTTTIKGVAIDMADALLKQDRIEISDDDGSGLTVKVAKLDTNFIINSGSLTLIGGSTTASNLQTTIDGIGNTEMQQAITVSTNIAQNNISLAGATVTVSTETNATVKATTINVDENSSLTANANNIDTFAAGGAIVSSGTLMFVGGTNSNIIDGNGQLIIDGNVINSTGKSISQSSITVASGSFETNASDLTTNGILNKAELTLTGGTLAASNKITGNGNLAVTGDFTNNAAITQSSVTIASGTTENNNSIVTTGNGIEIVSGATLITHGMIDTFSYDGKILNEGVLEVAVSNEHPAMSGNTITGTNGIFKLTSGEFINYDETGVYGGSIKQARIIISSNAILTSSLTAVTTTDGILSGGTINFAVNEEDTATNNNVISGNGVLNFAGGTVTNNANIEQNEINVNSGLFANNDGKTVTASTITVAAGSGLTANANDITAIEKVANSGTLTYTGGTNKNVIDGNGQLVIEGAVVNSTGTSISQSSITVASGSFETSANDITTTDGILNEAELTLTGGTLAASNKITGNGNLAVTGDLQNNAAISQSSITVTSNYFDNVSGSSITAKELVATTRFMTDAADLNISDSIELTTADSMLEFRDMAATVSTITANITGNGYLVQAGSATVVLSGTNDYAGTTTISAGALQISTSTNISSNTVYMDGGKLIVNTDNGAVTLANKFVGTNYNNDVNIEITGSSETILTGAIAGNKNLVKTGEGILNLQMSTNSYIGNTEVKEGTLIGTTKNINGKITGNGSSSAVEFYDDAEIQGDVILNEIADMGIFAKTGSSTMTVIDAFKAQTANISNGIFIVNNADVNGNANTDFIVLGSMTVTNTLLKGYSNITAKDLIISTGATFALGNSTATVKVSGNLKFEGDGTYDVEMGQYSMNEAGHYNDNTKVGGTTTIEENAKLILNNVEGKYYLPEEITIIEGGVSQANYKDENITFNDSDAEGLRAGFDTRISTTVYAQGNNLIVKMERKASEYANAGEFARSHNEQEAANSIDAISQGHGGDITSALDTLEKFYYYKQSYSTDSLKAALNDVAGVIHANATNLTFFNAKSEHIYDKIKERTLDLFPCTKFHNKIWAEYYYNNYNVDKDDNSPKYDTNVNGFLVGFDAISAKGWMLGVMAGYGTSELKQVSDKVTMNDINAGLYGGYEGSKWSFKSMLLGGYESYDITRQIAFMERRATSEHKGYSGALDAELGYKISLNKEGSNAKHKMYLRPFIGAIGSYMNNEGYQEKGAGDLNLKIEGYDSFAAEARAGVGINGKVKKFGWYAKAGARQLLTDKYNEVETSLLNFSDSTKMKIRSAENSQTTLTGGIGADYQLSDAWTVFANGLGNFGDKATSYYANVGVAYKFGCINNKPKVETSNKDIERLSDLLESQLDKDASLKKKLKAKQKRIDAIDKRKKQIEAREQELQDRIQKYEANIVDESKAAKLKEKALKQIKLKNKPTFVFGTAKLTKKGKAALAQVVEELKQYPKDSEILLEGYTDSVGADEVNQKVSEDRALAIATTLKKDYKVKNNINVIGKGEKDPIASNAKKAGRAKNRRVEITITAPEQ